MTSHEIVRRTVTFSGPERIAMSLPDPYPDDFCTAGATADPEHPPTDWEEVSPGRWEHTDEWGNLWARIENRSKGEVARPAVEEWDMLEEIELPNYDLPERYEKARRIFGAEQEKFRIGEMPGFPFNIARKMRRIDNFLVDLLAEPSRAQRLLQMVEQQLHHAIRHLAEAGADAITFAEDWGTQARLFVRLELWRRLFEPGFERLCRTAHEAGVFVFMHSCGRMSEAMEDMVKAGIDLFQFDQPTVHGIDWLGENFNGRATFWCPVDIQKTLQTRDPEAIEADARKMIERLGAGGGGFVAGYYGGDEAIGLEPWVQDVACRAFVKYGAPELWNELSPDLPPLPVQSRG